MANDAESSGRCRSLLKDVIAYDLKQDEDLSHYDADDEQKRLLLILAAAYLLMLKAVNVLVASHFGLDLAQFVVDDNTTRRVLLDAAARVVRIDQTTRLAIAATLREGQARGLNTWQLAHGDGDTYKGIDGLFQETWVSRALTVARTELQHAQLVSSKERYLASGLVDRVQIIDGCQWDDACCKRNGTIVPIEQAPTLNHPNCTLVLIPLLRQGVQPVSSPQQGDQPALL